MNLLATYAIANAAKFCENMIYAGYSDWYLPARHEMDLLYQNSAEIGSVINMGPYWTSNESGATNAWYYDTNNGYPSIQNKTSVARVRCIRRF